MITRPGTYDESMIRDGGASYKKLQIEPGDVVLDLGAHIGGFAVYAAKRGASRVVCYEPEASNVDLLAKNTAGLPVEIRPYGVMAEPGTLPLHVSTGPHTGHHSFMIDSRVRVDRAVQVVAFRDVLADVQPVRIKIDIEGAEHALDFGGLPATVRAIAIEIEMSRGAWLVDADRIDGQIRGLGFENVRKVYSGYGVWIWRRNS